MWFYVGLTTAACGLFALAGKAMHVWAETKNERAVAYACDYLAWLGGVGACVLTLFSL